MEKIIAIVIGVLIIILSGCSGNRDASGDAEDKVRDAITQFYKERQNSPVEYGIDIFKIKPLEEDFMAVAQQRGEEGQPSLDLLLIQKKSGKYYVAKAGFGSIALSMGFSVNQATYENKTIVFGSLKDSTWIPETDKRRNVNYAEVKAVFNNGNSISEKVKGDKVYLLIVDGVSGLKDLAFYNEKGQVQGTFKELGIQIEKVDFCDPNNRQVSIKRAINLTAVIDEKLDVVITGNSRASNPYDYIKGSKHIKSISVPEDFGFIMKFGTEGKNVLNTFEGTFTKDLVKAGTKTTKLLLTKEELQKIYVEMVKMDIWHNPERFKPSHEGDVITIVHPASPIYFKIRSNKKSVEVFGPDALNVKTSDQKRLKDLSDLISDMIVNKEEFKKMPESVGNYD